jgi:hypothetical protein
MRFKERALVLYPPFELVQITPAGSAVTASTLGLYSKFWISFKPCQKYIIFPPPSFFLTFRYGLRQDQGQNSQVGEPRCEIEMTDLK